jgi:mevalonate kinase
VLLILFSACNENAAKALRDASVANDIVQKFAIDAHSKGLMTTEETRLIVEGTTKIAESGKVAVAVLRGIHAQDPESRSKALDAIGLVADQLGALIKTLDIKNDRARREIEAGLLVVQTGLNSARLIVAGSN